MNKSVRSLFVLIVSIQLAGPLLRAVDKVEADGTDVLKQKVATLGTQATGTDDEGKPMVEPSYKSSVASSLARLRSNLEEQDFRAAAQTCEGIIRYAASPAFRKSVTELSAQISDAYKAKQSAVLSQGRALVAGLPAACAKAVDTADLETLAGKVQEAQAAFNKLYGNYSSELSPAVVSLRENLSAATSGIREWMNARIAEEAGDLVKALESLNKLSSSYTSSSLWQNSKEYEAKVDALRATLAAKVESVLATARDAMAKASTSREIETATADFNKMTERLRRSLNYDGVLQQQVEGIRTMFMQWSRVLAAEEKGDAQQALTQLAGLDSDYMTTRTDAKLRGIVANKREALTKKLFDQPVQADDAVTKLVAEDMKKADTLDKLIALRTKLTSFQTMSSFSGYRSMAYGQGELAGLLADLAMLESLNNAIQSRQFAAYLQAYPVHGPATSHRWKDTTRRQWNVLKAQLFATIFDLGTIKLAANETADQSLMKAADAALDDKEWERALRALDAYRVCLFGNQTPPATLADQIDSIRNFIAAKNFEKAGEIERAAACYLRVLQAPAEHTPVAAATKEIARLRKERPDLFEKLRATPPAPLTKLERDGSTRAAASPLTIYSGSSLMQQQMQLIE